jgi:hypothetical protein
MNTGEYNKLGSAIEEVSRGRRKRITPSSSMGSSVLMFAVWEGWGEETAKPYRRHHCMDRTVEWWCPQHRHGDITSWSEDFPGS